VLFVIWMVSDRLFVLRAGFTSRYVLGTNMLHWGCGWDALIFGINALKMAPGDDVTYVYNSEGDFAPLRTDVYAYGWWSTWWPIVVATGAIMCVGIVWWAGRRLLVRSRSSTAFLRITRRQRAASPA
jgi:hypothetical protein